MEPDAGLKLTDTNEEGVDLTLIRWFLTLTPAERLEYLDSYVSELFKMIGTMAVHSVEFIVAGGSAGVPDTLSLKIVHLRTTENIGRLLAALGELEAQYRMRRDLTPGESHLASAGHQLLITKYGALDVLGEIGEYGRGLRYEDLLARSHLVDVGGLNVRVLDLDYLIELKEQAGRDKDRASLPTLRATLAEIKRPKTED